MCLITLDYRNPRIVSGGRSFFVRDEFSDLGYGLELWRGYFQYVVDLEFLASDLHTSAFTGRPGLLSEGC